VEWLLIMAIFLGITSAISGVYGFKDFTSVTGRIASVLFLICFVAFIIVVVLQI